jgi:glycosyltransferase involved in cell wall biosynthesis
VIFLLDLPNPVHGMSSINLAFKNRAVTFNLSPKVINTVPSYAARFFTTRLWGVFKIIHTIFCYFRFILLSATNINGDVYRPINGGAGQVYDLIYLIIARTFLHKIYIHHHSFNYLNSKSTLFSLLNVIAGKSATHVVLGPKMKSVLSDLYGINEDNIIVISNLAFFDFEKSKIELNKCVRLGHLANLCVEKGVDTFIDVCRLLQQKEIDFTAEIAGPFADVTAKLIVTNALKEIPQLKYVGPLYNQDKDKFYKNLDCFIFPSKYKNEAEPLVLFEAANSGSLLVGSQRGCMQDVIRSLNGFSFIESTHLADDIANAITYAVNDDIFTDTARDARLALFQEEHVKADTALLTFLKELGRYELSKAK